MQAVVADLRGNGRNDVAVANFWRDSVSILFSEGGGAFAEPIDLQVGARPFAIVAADFNGDGRLDLATLSTISGDVSILLNHGDGTFESARHVSFGSNLGAAAFAFADFDGDGVPDLVVALEVGQFWVFLGKGNGDFGPPRRFMTPRPSALAVADFNGDGFLDLALGGSNGSVTNASVRIFFGNGKGGFVEGPPYQIDNAPDQIVIGDFNSDGVPDMAVAPLEGQGISIFLGDGKGGFSQSTAFPNSGSQTLLVGDFNRDGKLDLVLGGPSLAVGDGTGKFADPVVLSDLAGYPVATGDLSGRGTRDLVVTTWQGVLLVMESGVGRFSSPNVVEVQSHPSAIVAADFNGDGLPDLAVGTDYSDQVDLVMRQRSGEFAVTSSASVGGPVRSMAAADFGLAVARGSASCVTPGGIPIVCPGPAVVILPVSGGEFGSQKEIALEHEPSAIAVGNFSHGVQAADLVVLDPDAGSALVFLKTELGDFLFPHAYEVGQSPQAVTVADFNGDGLLDLAVANNGSHDVSILLGQDGGAFSPATTLAACDGPVAIVAADFDRDGRMDIAVACSGSKSIVLRLGLGDGTFGPPQPFSLRWAPTALTAIDVNGDGYLDLAVATVANSFDNLTQEDASYLAILDFRSATGNPLYFPVGRHPVALAAADLNSDGAADLVTANSDSDDISLLLGTCSTAQPPVTIGFPSRGVRVVSRGSLPH